MIESKPTKDDIFYNPSATIAVTWGQFFVGAALYVLSYYLIDDAFGIWTEDLVTSSNMLKFIVGLLLLPIGLILWQSSIFRLSSHIGYHWIGDLLFLLLFTIALFTVGAIYFVRWGIQDWLQWDQSFTSEALVKLMQGVFLVLTMWLTGITAFHILLRAVLMRNLYTTHAQITMQPVNDNKSNYAEQEPLITSTEMTATHNEHEIDNGKTAGIRYGYGRRSDSEQDFEASSDKFFEYVAVFLFFFVYIPIFLWINCVNVSDWHRMYPSEIITKLASTTALTVDTWNIYFEFVCGTYSITGSYISEICYARLYYDLLYWYLFIFVVAIFSYVVNKAAAMRIFLTKRVYLGLNINFGRVNLNLISVTIGEIIFWILWIIMMSVIGHYFITVHFYDETDKVVMERWARYIGIMAIQFLTIMLFTSTRIRLWNDCFMISFEHLLAYHRFFGVLFILAGYIHLILWIVFWEQSGEETYKPFNVPLSYHADNFTPILMYYVMLFLVPVIYVGCTFYVIRRRYFELFYYTHLFGAVVMISSVLWHASQAWRYIIPPLSLYAIDRMIRMVNSARICKINSLRICVNGAENDNRIEITKLSFSVGAYSMKFSEAQYKKMNFKMGQYVFVNIGNISLHQWHPFTISSGEDENECYLQIQNEGASVSEMDYGEGIAGKGQFTSLLYALAQKVEKNELGAHEIELHVDGPYGKPFVYSGYDRVVLIGGGIGITPCHSIFSTLLSRSIRYGGKDSQAQTLPYCDLIWVARDSKMFSMYYSTWRNYEDHNDAVNNKFNVRLFATRNGGVSVVDDGDDGQVHEYKQDDDSEFNHVVPRTDGTMYTYGRPNWSSVLSIISDKANNPSRTVVFCCGPPLLVREVEKHAVKYGARFHCESFVF